MKLGLVAAALFLASTLAVNGGFGTQPLRLVIPLLVAVASAVGVQRLMRRGRRNKPPEVPSFDLSARSVSPGGQPLHPKASGPKSPPPPASGGRGKARKLF